MIIPDANLLLYAVNADSPMQERAYPWLRRLVTGSEPVGLCSAVAFAFIRISTQAKVFPAPLAVKEAFDYIDNWLAFPCVEWVDISVDDLHTIRKLLQTVGTAGNLVSDAYIAAIALRHNGIVHSADADFARFEAVRWVNPLFS